MAPTWMTGLRSSKRKWVIAGMIFGGFSWEEIFTAAYNVRQAAMHRTPLEKTHLYSALKLPGLLGDEKRAAEVSQVYKVVTDDPSVDADMREQAQKLLYPEEKPPMTWNELISKLLDLLERSCYKRAEREDFGWLLSKGAEIYEQVQFTDYLDHWRRVEAKQHPDSLEEFPDPEGTGLTSMRWKALDFRNAAAHRLPLVDVHWWLDWARKLAIMVGDRPKGEEIKRIADAWLEKEASEGRKHVDDFSDSEPQEIQVSSEWETLSDVRTSKVHQSLE